MWWKLVVTWLKEKVDLDVDLDLGDGIIAVSVTVSVGEAVVLAERFEWDLPTEKTASKKLLAKAATRVKLPIGAA